MGPPPRSLAAEANGCFMVRVRHGPNRIQGCGARDAPDSGLPSDQPKHPSTIGEQSDAIKLDTDVPIQGCVKTSARFHTCLFRSLLRGHRAFRVVPYTIVAIRTHNIWYTGAHSLRYDWANLPAHFCEYYACCRRDPRLQAKVRFLGLAARS